MLTYDCYNVVSDGYNCDDNTNSRAWCRVAEYMNNIDYNEVDNCSQ